MIAEAAGVKEVRIGDFCQTGSGGTPSRTVAEYFGGSIPWVKSGELRESVITGTEEHITDSGLENSAAKLLPANTLLVALYGATVGRVGVLGIEAATNQAICHIIPKPGTADVRYLFYALRSKVAYWLDKRVGGGQPNISQGVIKDTFIPLPPLAEQKRIAGILDAADALRAKRREALAQLDTLLRATFLDLFGDPVTNPKKSPVRKLSEFYINDRDGTKCGPFGSALKKEEFVESGVPVWNMDNIDPSGRMVLPFRSWITSAKYEHLESYAVLDGDVLISRAGTVGKMCVARSGAPRSIISTNLIRVRFGKGLLPIHFVSLMTFCKGRVGRLKVGPDGAFTHMSTGVLDDLQFPYPPIEVQHRYDRIAESIENQKESHRAHLAELDTLFASLQSRAFRGEL